MLFKTTDAFLRTFSISSVDELPPLPDAGGEEDGQMKIIEAINALKTVDSAPETEAEAT